jgi:hypothetical protein
MAFLQWYVTTLPLHLLEWIIYPVSHTFYYLRG